MCGRTLRQLVSLGRLRLATAGSSHSTPPCPHTYTHVLHHLVSPAMQRWALSRGRPRSWSWWARRPEGRPVREIVCNGVGMWVDRHEGELSCTQRNANEIHLCAAVRHVSLCYWLATAGYSRQQSLNPTPHTYTHALHRLVLPAMQRWALSRGRPLSWSWWARRPERQPV